MVDRKKKLYVIGSVAQANWIKTVAQAYRRMGFRDIRYVMPEPEKSRLILIEQCFKNIIWADHVIAIQKPDGTFGDGVSYEITFAKLMGKPVAILDPNEFN